MLSPLSSWDEEATWQTFEDHGFHNNVYAPGGQLMPVEIQKHADDMDRYRELVEMSQPDLVIETGTRAGGSALFFRELGLQVVTIDVAPQFQVPPYEGPGIEWVTCFSVAPSVINRVAPHAIGKRVMVSLDSDHHASTVSREMAIWGSFVSAGCYLVAEDGCFDAFGGERARRGGSRIPEEGGTLRALRDSGIENSPAFWRDEELEGKTAISHSPCGWWRRHE
jgi:cephalosporin hydroxylase